MAPTTTKSTIRKATSRRAVRSPARPRTVTLRCYASTAPGLDWDCLVRFVPKGTRVEVWLTPDLDTGKPVRVTTLNGALEPRALVKVLLRRGEELGLHGDFFDEARVSGVRGVWADMLRLAWVHEGDPDTADVARALLTFDDEHLARLHKHHGGFDLAFAARISTILGEAEYAGLGRIPLAKLFSRASADGTDVDAVEAEFPRWQAEQEAREAARQAKKEAELAPFKAEVERILANWDAATSGYSSQAGEAVFRIRRGLARQYLESYVLWHRELPSGVHKLPRCSVMSDPGSIDFDELRQPASDDIGEQ